MQQMPPRGRPPPAQNPSYPYLNLLSQYFERSHLSPSDVLRTLDPRGVDPEAKEGIEYVVI